MRPRMMGKFVRVREFVFMTLRNKVIRGVWSLLGTDLFVIGGLYQKG